ncbi:MAG: RHS repeat domain-containing protein [Aureispira sp.]
MMRFNLPITTAFFVLLGILCALPSRSYAHEVEYIVKEEKINLTVGKVLTIVDPSIIPAGAVEGMDFIDRHKAIVELNYDRSNRTDIAGQVWSYEVSYDLIDALTNTVIDSGIIQLNNSDAKGVYESLGLHENVSRSVNVRITAITTSAGTAPDDIHLALKLQVERYSKLDETIAPTMALSSTVPDAKQQVEVYWRPTTGAEYYELEWVYWDGENTTNYTAVSDKELFEQGVRIQTSATHYKVDLVYPKGTVHFRVRPVGCFVAGGLDNPVEKRGKWSAGQVVTLATGFEADKNWSFNRSYAEEGKNKQVIQYFDDGLKGRQALTTLSSEDITLVSESLYDVENRPALAVMPVPVKNDAITGSNLQFGAGHNNGLITTGGVTYSRIAYDKHNTQTAATLSQALPQNHIANQYYSSANTFNSHLNRDYVPDAEGYPVAQTSYDNDGRSYVKANSGVGAFYQLGTGRESAYYYASPTTTELQTFFGENVGAGEYYRKTWAKDANGQLSVSITDQAGQTILTALDGAIPDNVQALDGSSKIKTETLMGSNITNPLDQTSEVHHTFMCTQDSATYSFEYNLLHAVNVLQSDYDFCLGCTYELEIKVEDQYGNLLPLALTTANDSVSLDTTGTILTSAYSSNQNPCTDTIYQPVNAIIAFDLQLEQIGTYTIHKTLRATGPNANDILAHLLTLDSVMDQSTFVNNYVTTNFDSTECRGNNDAQCQSLCEEVILANHPHLDLSDANDLALYQLLIDTCMMGNCDSLLQQYSLRQIIGANECEALLLQMKQQMSPGGCWYEKRIYTRLYDNGNGVSIPDVVLNTGIGTIYPTITFNDTSDIRIYLQDPTIWQDSWADDLVVLHPEYCRYLACGDSITIESKIYDFEIANYRSWQEAGTALGVTVSTPATYLEQRATLTAMINADPYFQNNNTLDRAFSSLLDNYCTIQCSTVNTQNNTTACTCSCLDVICYLNDNLDTIQSLHWDLFRGVYGDEKQKMIYDNQCPLAPVPGSVAIKNPCPTLTGPPIIMTIDQNGDTSFVNLSSDTTNVNDISNLLYNNVLGHGANSNTNSLCNQLCAARADLWIQQMCPDFRIAALADSNSAEAATYNVMMTQLVNYCLTGCGQLTRPDSALYPYQANPLGHLVAEDLNYPPFTGTTGIIAILDNLQNNNPSYCGTGGGAVILDSIAVRHDSLYQLNITSNNVFANLPVDSTKCSLLTDVFTSLDNNLFPTRYVIGGGTVPQSRTFNHATVLSPSLVMGLPSQETYTGGAPVSGFSNPYFISTSHIFLDNEYLYDTLGNRTGYNRAIRIRAEFLEDACTNKQEIEIELEHQITRQLINPMAIVSLGTYNCLDNTIQVVYATPDCRYPNNTQGANIANTACPNPPILDTAKAYVILSTDACTPSWELPPDSTWVPIVRTVTINLDSAIAACDSSQIAALTQDAQDAYQQYLNTLVNQVLTNANCVPVEEAFHMTFESNEQHYTLYYYDAAGNLVQTLPPAAVHPLESSQVGTGVHPLHNYDLLTTYTYNSLGQILTQQSPDGGLSTFYYDYAQRLRLSQNARQAPIADDLATYGTGGDYAYSKYDARGRVIEVGKLENYAVNPTDLNAFSFPNTTNNILSQQTITEYDRASGQGSLTQNNLRSRVARTYNEDIATYYDYDIHGNVKQIQHQIKQFGVAEIAYDYDLITGNVNQVAFQEGTKEAYYHRYQYDADNRLTHVFTSDNACLWQQEARYFYYAHGPLARVELGTDKVQGVDYYYSLQGWIKGVNNTTTATDPGKDGDVAAISFNRNQWIGKDEQAYYLGYHREDYKPIGGNIMGAFEHTNTSIFDNDLRPAVTSSTTGLYNGNIAFMMTHLPSLEHNTVDQKATNAMVYQYDALNRIKQARSYHFANGTTWAKDATNEHHNTNYDYDANGNIETLQRYHKGVLIDNLSYKYIGSHSSTPNNLSGPKYNQLHYIEDIGTGVPTVGDLANQATSNYVYDAIGNLIKDQSQDIANIEWDLSNKIEKVTYNAGSGKSPLEYTYDAMGQRLTKTKTVNGERISTVYVRDASGNIMGVYEMVDTIRANIGLPGNGSSFPIGTTVHSKRLQEVALYGSARLGLKRYSNNWEQYRELRATTEDMAERPISFLRKTAKGDRGNKVYELSNHLGNVLATVSDKKLGQILGGSTVASYYEAQVQSAQDYYAFGWNIPSRSIVKGKKYMYGFNGQVEDDEWNGGQSVNFLFRIHDPRVGRFLSVDPLASHYAWNTPYGFAENDVIRSRDLEGAERSPTTGRPSCGSGTTQSSGTSSTQMGGSNAPGGHQSGEGMKQGGKGNTSNSGSKMPRQSMARKADKFVKGAGIIPNPYVHGFRIGWKIGQFGKDLYLLQQELFRAPENGLDILIPDSQTQNEGENEIELIPFKLSKKSPSSDSEHGNRRDNRNPHIVYEIFVIDDDGNKETLKYGIGDQTSYGSIDGRPKLQVAQFGDLWSRYIGSDQNLTGKKHTILDYIILYNTRDRQEALNKEQELVDEFFEDYGRKPYEQLRPLATPERRVSP